MNFIFRKDILLLIYRTCWSRALSAFWLQQISVIYEVYLAGSEAEVDQTKRQLRLQSGFKKDVKRIVSLSYLHAIGSSSKYAYWLKCSRNSPGSMELERTPNYL